MKKSGKIFLKVFFLIPVCMAIIGITIVFNSVSLFADSQTSQNTNDNFTQNNFSFPTTSSFSSDWDLWYLKNTNQTGHKVYVNGEAKLQIKTVTTTPVSLNLGIVGDQDNNFVVNGNNNNFFADIYVELDLNPNSSFKFGYLNAGYSKAAILKERGYNTPFISNFLCQSNGAVACLNGGYMQYNHAFSFDYQHTFVAEGLRFNLRYTPSLRANIVSNENSLYDHFNHAVGVMETGLDYYTEVNDVGYGIIGALRNYSQVLKNKGFEFMISPNIDYLGFGFAGSIMAGRLNAASDLPVGIDAKYLSEQLMLNYSIVNVSIGGDLTYTHYNQKHSETQNNTKETLSLAYMVNPNLNLNAAIFNSKDNNRKSWQGIGLGFTLKTP